MKRIVLAILVLLFVSTSYAFSTSEQEQHALCAGYADQMREVYTIRHYNWMVEYYSVFFSRDIELQDDPVKQEKLRSLYNKGLESVNTKGNIKSNLNPVCELEFKTYLEK